MSLICKESNVDSASVRHWRHARLRWLTSITLFACGLTIASPVGHAQQNTTDRIDVVAVVNGAQITRPDLAAECLSRHGEEVLESMVNRQLIVNASRRHQISVDATEIQEEIDRVAAKWGLSADRWLSLLKEERNIDAPKYQEYIWTTLMLRKLAAERISVTAEEVDQVLESEIGPKVQARLITASNAENAAEIHALVTADPDSFGRVARERSADVNSRANSGLINPIRRFSGTPIVEQAAFSLQPGQISDILEIEEQYWIIKCEAINPRLEITQAQEQVARQRIIEHLYDKKLAEAADGMFEAMQAEVTIQNTYNDPDLQAQYPGVAATIDAVPITVQQLSEECISRHGIDVLELEIHRILLLQELQRYGMEIQENDIHAEISRAAEALGFVTETGAADIDAWLEFETAETGMTVELYVRDIVWPSKALKLLVQDQVSVAQEDIDKGWDANFGPRVEALAIVLQDDRRANQVWQMAMQNKNPTFFGELARQYSTEPASQANDGKIPPIQRYGGRERLETEAFALQPGEISGIIQMGDHRIILYCLGHTEPVVQDRNDQVILDELYNDIYEKKLRIAMGERFASVYGSAQIDNFLTGTTQSPRRDTADQRNGVPGQTGGRVPFGPTGINR